MLIEPFLVKKFHGTFSRVPWNFLNNIWTTPVVPWNFLQIQSSMEFHGTFSILPSSMEFHGTFFWSSMEFHGIPWNLINFIFKKIIFLIIVFGIWLMIRCYLAKISQKRYKLHWFQYRNSYFEHPSVNENGTRSAKMACCLYQLLCGWMIDLTMNSHQIFDFRSFSCNAVKDVTNFRVFGNLQNSCFAHDSFNLQMFP